MTYFLTSSTAIPGTNELNPENGFMEELKMSLPGRGLSGVFVCSDPDDRERTEKYGYLEKACFERAGFRFSRFEILDGQSASGAAALLGEADAVILAGGHVPTQNRFFAEIGLKELIKSYEGVVIGISAGSMNSAELVYAHPEREGEAACADYRRFLPGLGLTRAMVLPHYDSIREDVLDGLRVIEDIAYPDSLGRRFYALADGSYILGRGGVEELRGEAYLIQDAAISKICGKNEAAAVL